MKKIWHKYVVLNILHIFALNSFIYITFVSMKKIFLIASALTVVVAAAAQTGTVLVKPTPSKAAVTFDNNVVVQEGNTFTLRPGESVMTLTHSSYNTYQEVVTVKEGDQLVLTPLMKKLSATKRFYNHSGKVFVGLFDLSVYTKDNSSYCVGLGVFPMRIKRLGLNLFNAEITGVKFKDFDKDNFAYELRYRPEIKYHFPLGGHVSIAPYIAASFNLGHISKTEADGFDSDVKFSTDDVHFIAGTALALNAGGSRFRVPIEVFGEYRMANKGDALSIPTADDGIYFGARISINWALGIIAGAGVAMASML